MSATGPRGTNDWQRYEFEREIDPTAINVIFGFFLQGRGTAWFDDLRIEVDGRPIAQTAPFTGEPSADHIEWLRSNSIPFATERAGSGFQDLQPLKELIGGARVVGLGEATHGTAEFFRMKHRLLEWLATEMGYTIFSIEANMPESYRMNDYVLTGRGNPRELLRGMYFWTWQTEEVLAMVEWMREFNRSGRGRIQFTGFDMQTWTVAGTIVRAFVERADPAYIATLDEAWTQIRETRSLPVSAANLPRLTAAAAAANAARRYLEDNARRYMAAFPLAEVDWAIQNARVVEQAAHLPMGGTLHRDEMMALNT
jgi:erythromycin esterase